jgi:hypothetical protein
MALAETDRLSPSDSTEEGRKTHATYKMLSHAA